MNTSNTVAHLKYRTSIHNLYFSIILFNTFTNNITNFVSSKGYH
ncbi:ATP synthase CF1 alpha subunit [Iris pallida]|uniref:ATP synthase CF1 alpha subunit (Chloroplast) n=1 Tax=Iris pallida TaxID=29817 RepID=A0AAX6DX93_IRIPA|nr:ATP synthase CF1 alpha subunit [Iris pallida]